MRRYGLLGEKLSHSFSPEIHKYFYPDPYDLFEVEPCGVEAFLNEAPFDAINVTIPYKKTVMPFCSEISESAKRIGSVNTLVKRADGTLYGDNTDYYGFYTLAQKNNISFSGKKVLVLGSGGASQTAQAVAKDAGAREVIVISRSGENNYENISKHADGEIIINTTPVGMYPNCGKSPVDLSIFKNCIGVLDMIYNPSKTAFIMQAESLNIPCANGLLMLVAQAKKAAEIFTGEPLDDEICDKITSAIETKTKNILLIGMPGCGKSTVGKKIAEELSRKFVDTDTLIEEREGRKIPDIFASNGEEVFRKIETEVLAEVSKESGLVIATGGGIVTREENFPLAHQNSTVFFIDRDISELSSDGRPLSQKQGVKALYEARISKYRAFSDVVIKSGTIEENINKIKGEITK